MRKKSQKNEYFFLKIKISKLGMMVMVCILRGLGQEDHRFEDSLGYLARYCLQKTKSFKALTAQTFPARLLHTIERKTGWWKHHPLRRLGVSPAPPISESCDNLESYLVSLRFSSPICKVQKLLKIDSRSGVKHRNLSALVSLM